MKQPDPATPVSGRTRLERQLVAPSGSEDSISASLGRICSVAATDLGLSGAAITLMTEAGGQAVVADSEPRSRALEELTLTLGEGPAKDAFSYGRPVLVGDVGDAFPRWPGWAGAALELGAAAAYSFPVQLGAVRFGTFTGHCTAPRELDGKEVRRCLMLAEIATDQLLASSTSGTAHTPDPDLARAMHLRSEIYQAQGMVMVALDVSLAEALTRMRAHAFATGRDLAEVALGIIGGSLTLPRDSR